MIGFVSVYRKIKDSWIWDDPIVLKLFLFCLIEAKFKPKKTIYRGQICELEIGEFMCSLRTFSNDLNCSVKKVSRLLKLLEDDGILTHRRKHDIFIYKVSKYAEYQRLENENGNTDDHTEETQKTTQTTTQKKQSGNTDDHILNTVNTGNTVNTENNDHTIALVPTAPAKKSNPLKKKWEESFVAFWDAYPKKKGKQAALKAWMKLLTSQKIKTHDEANQLADQIMEGVETYSQATKTEDQKFIKHPQGWLNDGRWLDENSKTENPYEGKLTKKGQDMMSWLERM